MIARPAFLISATVSFHLFPSEKIQLPRLVVLSHYMQHNA